jgi:hypothetical protein
MKKILALLLLFATGHFIYGQEQITDIKSKNNSVRHILREIGPDKYVITIDKQDSLKVYKINGSTSVYMHSRYYACLWSENFLKYTGRYILIENVKGSVSYNFVEDEEYIKKNLLSKLSEFRNPNREIIFELKLRHLSNMLLLNKGQKLNCQVKNLIQT